MRKDSTKKLTAALVLLLLSAAAIAIFRLAIYPNDFAGRNVWLVVTVVLSLLFLLGALVNFGFFAYIRIRAAAERKRAGGKKS